MLRGTAQNPDVFFQAREAGNPFYRACPTIVQNVMDRFARVVPAAAITCLTMLARPSRARDRADGFRGGRGGRSRGVSGQAGRKSRRCSKFASSAHSRSEAFLAALPKTVRAIAVLDRTKEPGAIGEPMYSEVVTALSEAAGGYGAVAHSPQWSADDTAFVEGVHARDGQGRLR